MLYIYIQSVKHFDIANLPGFEVKAHAVKTLIREAGTYRVCRRFPSMNSCIIEVVLETSQLLETTVNWPTQLDIVYIILNCLV